MNIYKRYGGYSLLSENVPVQNVAIEALGRLAMNPLAAVIFS